LSREGGSTLLYLDSSSLVKLVSREAETLAMLALLEDRPQVASSALARVEVLRAVARAGLGRTGVKRAQEVLSRVSLIAVDDPILESATSLGPKSLRSLDAIHLATALSLLPDLEAVLCHDARLAAAAKRAGLSVLTPH